MATSATYSSTTAPSYYQPPTVAQNALNAASNVTNNALNYMDQQAAKVVAAASPAGRHNGLWNFAIMFVVIAIIIMLIVWLFKLPIGLQSGPGGVVMNQPSFGKILGAGVFGSLFVTLLIWLASKLFGTRASY